MTTAANRDKDVTPSHKKKTHKERIIDHLESIYPATKEAKLISKHLNINYSSCRKALRRLSSEGVVENHSNGPYRLTDNYFNGVTIAETQCDIDSKKIPTYLRNKLPEKLQYLKLGYPVECHGFHISCYPKHKNTYYKRMVFTERFKSGRVKFNSSWDKVEIKYGCRDDPLDATETCMLYDLILEKLAILSGSADHEVIIKQFDLHQDRHDLSYDGEHVKLEIIYQTLVLAAYETTRKNHPLVEQEKYLRLESRNSFPITFEQLTEEMARISAGIHTNVSQNVLNTTMTATMKQLNYERYNNLSKIQDATDRLEDTSLTFQNNTEEIIRSSYAAEKYSKEAAESAEQTKIETQNTQDTFEVAFDHYERTIEAFLYNNTKQTEILDKMSQRQLEDSELVERKLIEIQVEGKERYHTIKEKIDTQIKENRLEHDELFRQQQTTQKTVENRPKSEKKTSSQVSSMAIKLVELFQDIKKPLTSKQIQQSLKISAGRVSQIIGELKKNSTFEIKEESINTGRRGRPPKTFEFIEKEDGKNGNEGKI